MSPKLALNYTKSSGRYSQIKCDRTEPIPDMTKFLLNSLKIIIKNQTIFRHWCMKKKCPNISKEWIFIDIFLVGMYRSVRYITAFKTSAIKLLRASGVLYPVTSFQLVFSTKADVSECHGPAITIFVFLFLQSSKYGHISICHKTWLSSQ